MDRRRQEEIDATREVLGSLDPHASLVTVLIEVQDRVGYLPEHVMQEVAERRQVPDTKVYSVASFYNQFRLNPPGRHPVRVCLGTACHMKGGYIVLDAWKRRLGINEGETTPDREFDLDTVACVGCCAMAPVTVVDNEVEANTSPTRVDGILLAYQIEREKEQKKKK